MKEIPLTKGQVALVDDADFEYLSQWKWLLLTAKKKCGTHNHYAARKVFINGKQKTPYMHRVILGEEGFQVDHRDGNGLNNQRFNLRRCTQAQNQMNRGAIRPDRYKGVWFQKHAKKWTAQISIDGKRKYLGYFDYSTDAAIAYNEAATKFYGEFARLNQIPE